MNHLRIASVDVFRTLAIGGVIAIHTTPFESLAQPIGRSIDAATLVNQAARFAVPFFLVVSGWFWAAKVQEQGNVLAPTMRMVKRIAFVFAAWSAIYLLPVNIVDALVRGPTGPLRVVYWNLARALNKPVLTLLEGTSSHLWFLVGLMFSVCLSAVLLHLGLRKTLVAVVAILYGLGLAGMAYAAAPFGLQLHADMHNGHLHAPAFFVTGCLLRRRIDTSGWLPLGLILATLGFMVQLAEGFMIHRLWGGPLGHDYVAGTYLFGVGVALVALSGAARLGWSLGASVGPWVLGVYASHMIFVELLQPLERRLAGLLVWDLVFFAAVFGLSYGLARLLGRHPRTRPLVC